LRLFFKYNKFNRELSFGRVVNFLSVIRVLRLIFKYLTVNRELSFRVVDVFKVSFGF